MVDRYVMYLSGALYFYFLKGLGGRAHKKLRFKPGLVFIDGKHLLNFQLIFVCLNFMLLE